VIIHNICVVLQEVFVIFQNINFEYLEFSSETFWLSCAVGGRVVTFTAIFEFC